MDRCSDRRRSDLRGADCIAHFSHLPIIYSCRIPVYCRHKISGHQKYRALAMQILIAVMSLTFVTTGLSFYLEKRDPPFCKETQQDAPCDPKTEARCCHDGTQLAECVTLETPCQGGEGGNGGQCPVTSWDFIGCGECKFDEGRNAWVCSGA